MREKTVEAALVRRIRAAGGQCLKWTSPGTAGVPDRLVLSPCPCARVWFVELKRPGEKPRPLQEHVFERFALMGYEVAVIDTLEGVREFSEALEEHIRVCSGTI